MPRRITFPLPDNLGIEGAVVSALKTNLYRSIIKQVDIYNRMNEDPGTSGIAMRGMLNTPVFSDVTLQSSSDNTLKLTLDTALIVIEQVKKIGRTIVTGRNGTVKEYYSMNDFDITITGSIVDENATKYPNEKVDLLRQLVELPEALNVSGPFMELFNIFSAVVHTYKFDQKPGIQNAQFFEIKLWSDNPVELEPVT